MSVRALADGEAYDACFDLGHQLRLFDRPGTFRVSRAGVALGNYLLRSVRESEITGRVLDVGTGSGAIALLLRNMGVFAVAATDVSASAVDTAKENELTNFGDSTIEFHHGDLFPGSQAGQPDRYDLIIFNPPGWRAPSPLLEAKLTERHRSLDLRSMFYGDSILLRFLQQLPDHLTENGRAIIGFNSLLGIPDIVERSRATLRPRGDFTLHFRMLERVEFPLFFYTDEWWEVRSSLLSEFERGRQEYAAHYVTRGETLHWFYEITEVTAVPTVSPRSEEEVGLGSSALERT